jgi:hypothetical protein
MTATQRIQAARAYLALAAVAGAGLVFVALRNLHPVYGVIVAWAGTLAALWHWRGVFSRRRVVLWLEERLPELRFSLVALAEDPGSRFGPAFEERVRGVDARRVLVHAGLRLVGAPLLLLVAMQLGIRPILERTGVTAVGGSGASRSGRAIGAGGPRAFAAIVTAPAYSRIAADTVANPTAITALVGSDIRFTGSESHRATMPKVPTVLRLGGAAGRLVALEPRADSSPRVVLSLPARDTVLPKAGGIVTLSAVARDDIGIVSGWFEMIVSSGDGEAFKFRNAVIARTDGNGARDLGFNATLRLDTLGLSPGDIVHLRAVARDANPASDAEAGASETRTLRVYRRGESDSVEIEALPPPETGRSELSQRMLIIMTEALVTKTRSLARPAFTSESRSIGTEQSRLRKRVGQIIFTRLTGEEGEEEIDEALADSLSPAEALLKAASDATGEGADGHLHAGEGEDSPVVAVNRPLLEAFNAMWEAERFLGIGEPRQALPYMRSALDAIQRARAAERLYLRGRPPKVVLDIARIRLSGKKDGINPGNRSPRVSDVSAQLARQSRFNLAVALLSADSTSAAIDSLTLLRVDALVDRPSFAAALAAAISDLRSGRDAIASLRTARRVLNGAPAAGAAGRWSGQW